MIQNRRRLSSHGGSIDWSEKNADLACLDDKAVEQPLQGTTEKIAEQKPNVDFDEIERIWAMQDKWRLLAWG